MYHFVFAWMYLYHKKGGDTIYKHVASYAATLVFCIHVLTIISILEKIVKIKLFYFPDASVLSNRFVELILIVMCFVAIDLVCFNKKRTAVILSKYPDSFKLHTFKNYSYWFLIFFVPSFIVFYLS